MRVLVADRLSDDALDEMRTFGVDDAGRVAFEDERGEPVTLDFENIDSAHLVFEWKTAGARAGGKQARGREAGSHGKPGRPQGSK